MGRCERDEVSRVIVVWNVSIMFILFFFLKDLGVAEGEGQEDSQPKAWGKS